MASSGERVRQAWRSIIVPDRGETAATGDRGALERFPNGGETITARIFSFAISVDAMTCEGEGSVTPMEGDAGKASSA
jgi:hypothetical protein